MGGEDKATNGDPNVASQPPLAVKKAKFGFLSGFALPRCFLNSTLVPYIALGYRPSADFVWNRVCGGDVQRHGEVAKASSPGNKRATPYLFHLLEGFAILFFLTSNTSWFLDHGDARRNDHIPDGGMLL